MQIVRRVVISTASNRFVAKRVLATKARIKFQTRRATMAVASNAVFLFPTVVVEATN